MIKIILLVVITCLFPKLSFASESIVSVFEKLDELIIRAESGVPINSFTESFADMRIAYKKVSSESSKVDNPFVLERIDQVISKLEEYVLFWRESDGKESVRLSRSFSSYNISECRFYAGAAYGDMYKVSCVRPIILSEVKSVLEKAKSSHIYGW